MTRQRKRAPSYYHEAYMGCTAIKNDVYVDVWRYPLARGSGMHPIHLCVQLRSHAGATWCACLSTTSEVALHPRFMSRFIAHSIALDLAESSQHCPFLKCCQQSMPRGSLRHLGAS